MKKRNWLMTIAFAVLSLTIVSTMVIGSTYAKFTSKVVGESSAQAAGFLIAGTITNATVSDLMAPGEGFTKDITITYFSQVPTKISEAGAASGMTGTGVFDTTYNAEATPTPETIADSTWGKLIAIYNANVSALAAATGATGVAVKNDLLPSDLITYTAGSGSSTVEEFIKQVYANLGTKTTVYGSTNIAKATSNSVGYNDVIPAMLSTQAAVLSATLSINVQWTTLHGDGTAAQSEAALNDLFDTFIGAAIAGFATHSAVSIGSVEIVGGTNGVALPASATNSEIGFSVGLAAEQVSASAYAGYGHYEGANYVAAANS